MHQLRLLRAFLDAFLESSVHFLVFQTYVWTEKSVLPESLCPRLHEPFRQGRAENGKSKLESAVLSRWRKNAGDIVRVKPGLLSSDSVSNFLLGCNKIQGAETILKNQMETLSPAVSFFSLACFPWWTECFHGPCCWDYSLFFFFFLLSLQLWDSYLPSDTKLGGGQVLPLPSPHACNLMLSQGRGNRQDKGPSQRYTSYWYWSCSTPGLSFLPYFREHLVALN